MQWPNANIYGIKFVKGKDAAMRAACLPNMPDGSTLLMDESEAIFYIRTSGQFSGVTLTAYRFEEIEPPVPEGYVKQEEYNKLKDKYESLIEQHTKPGSGS